MQDVLLKVVGCWPVKITSCSVILGFFEYLLNWHRTDVFFTYIHLIPLITYKQPNQVSFKPLRSTWPTYDTKSSSSTLSNIYILNVLPCSPDSLFWFQCVIRGAWPSKHSGKIEAVIKHKRVHLRMRSDRRKVGQLKRISNLNAEMNLFLSCVRFLQ